MRLAIFGGTGKTGREIVTQALSEGHTVTVLARNPDDLAELRDRIRVVWGDVTEMRAVLRTVAGSDAVISALGPRRGSPEHLLAIAAKNIVSAMRAEHVRRIVVMSPAHAVPDEGDAPSLTYRLGSRVLDVIAIPLLRDHAEQARILRGSDLDWTIVRPLRLAGGPRTGDEHAGPLTPETAMLIHRADVAAFMLECATTGAYIHEMPVVSRQRAHA